MSQTNHSKYAVVVNVLLCLAALSVSCGRRDKCEMIGVKQNGKWGYVDKTGKVVINPQFDAIGQFGQDCLASAEVGDKWGYIDRTGKYAINPQFDAASAFSEGLADVSVGPKEGFIDQTGKMVINPQFDLTGKFSEGLAMVGIGEEMSKYKYGFIDKTGKYVINPQFKETGWGFKEGLASVEVAGKWGYIDKTSKTVITPQFDYALNFSEGLALVKVGGKCGYIDKSGKMVVNPRFDEARPFFKGLAVAKTSGAYGYIDKTGAYAITPQFEQAWPFSEGRLAAVRVGGRWGYINDKGKYVVNPQFQNASVGYFDEGVAAVKVGDKWGFTDETGNIVVSPQFDDVAVDLKAEFEEKQTTPTKAESPSPETTPIGDAHVELPQQFVGNMQQGPFGFRAGMSKEEIEAAIGKPLTKDPNHQDAWVAIDAPHGHPLFAGYDLLIDPNHGLVELLAVSREIETSVYGTELRSKYLEIKEAVTKTYGPPDLDYDHLNSGSLWTEPQYFMMGLRKKDRQLEAVWLASRRQLPELKDKVTTLSLDAHAQAPSQIDKGRISLTYWFVGFEQWSAGQKQKEGSAF